MNNSTKWLVTRAIASVLAFSSLAFAADFPSQPIKIIVPYPPGGGTDVLTRITAKYLQENLKQTVIVENKPGAGAVIGINTVSKAPADGHTLMAIAAGPLNSENLSLFEPIALFAAPAYLVVVHPDVPAKTLPEFIAYAKANGAKLSYGSTGGGAASHLSAELLKAMAGIEILHVPYKGTGQAVTDLLGGQIQMMVAPTQTVIAHVNSNKLRALAATGKVRSVAAPTVPTAAEAGLADYEATGWFGIVAPANTPKDVVQKLNREINAILSSADVKERLAQLGATPANLSPQQFLQFIRNDNEKWAKLIKERKLETEIAR